MEGPCGSHFLLIYLCRHFLFCLISEAITTAHLSILMYCGYPRKDTLSLLPILFIYSTNVNVDSEHSNLESFQTMSSWTEQKCLDPLVLLELKGTGLSDFYSLKGSRYITDIPKTNLFFSLVPY